MPPLRKRREDIYLLVHHFVKRYAMQYDKSVRGVEPHAMEVLVRYNWPGNVRELKNYIARGVILSKKPRLSIEDLPQIVVSDTKHLAPFQNNGLMLNLPENGYKLRDMERELIRLTYEKCCGNKSLAAQQLGISRKTLYDKLARYAIRPH